MEKEKHEQASQIMFQQIDIAYADAAVKQRPALREILLKSAQALQKGENCQLVATKLTKAITLYYWEHQKDYPAALNTLYHQIKGQATKYDAVATSALMMPIWFH